MLRINLRVVHIEPRSLASIKIIYISGNHKFRLITPSRARCTRGELLKALFIELLPLLPVEPLATRLYDWCCCNGLPSSSTVTSNAIELFTDVLNNTNKCIKNTQHFR